VDDVVSLADPADPHRTIESNLSLLLRHHRDVVRRCLVSQIAAARVSIVDELLMPIESCPDRLGR